MRIGWYIRMAVANNPSTPAYVLFRLALDEDVYVRETARRNDNMTRRTTQAPGFSYGEDVNSDKITVRAG